MSIKARLRERPLHIMLLPAVILTLIYSYGPMAGIVIAFQDFDPAKLFKSPWVGLKNFEYIFNLPGSFRILWNTLFIATSKVVGLIIVAVIFALLLNEINNRFFKRTLQSLIYIPNFMSWIIMAGILIDILSPSEGIVNKTLGVFGIEPVFFLGDKKWFPVTMILSDIWKTFGFETVIYLAALTGIDPTQYESAVVDGANRWKQTLYITIPGITPMIILVTVLSLGGILNAGFDQVFNLYSPSVYETGDIIDTFVYRLGLQQLQYSPAAAVGLFKSVVSFALIWLSYFLANKFANYRIF